MSLLETASMAARREAAPPSPPAARDKSPTYAGALACQRPAAGSNHDVTVIDRPAISCFTRSNSVALDSSFACPAARPTGVVLSLPAAIDATTLLGPLVTRSRIRGARRLHSAQVELLIALG